MGTAKVVGARAPGAAGADGHGAAAPAAPVGACCTTCPAQRPVDPLTGLADRRQFREALDAALAAPPPAAAARGDGAPTGPALLLIDLDRFKLVNDTLGYLAGDALLQAVGKRLRSVVRGADLCARFGGDEFAVLLGAPAGRDAAEGLARRLVDVLSRPYLVDGRVAMVGASVGLALAPEDAGGADALIACADLALYAAKAAGRGDVRRFEPAMQARAEDRRTMEQALRAALPLGQLSLHYQAQVALGENRLTGFEALLRWRHPQRGMVPPDVFIPLAAEIRLLPTLGAWVLRTACREARGWPEPLRVAVNVTPDELAAGRLLQAVGRALQESGLPGRRLEVELTEVALLNPTDTVMAQLHGLRALGVQVSLDDFGTGFSSLTQLRSFPFDRIKLDRRFAEDGAVVRAVAGLGAALGMRTTAEGIETEAQLARMREGGVTDAQGYLLGRPVPAGDLPAVIARWGPPPGAAAPDAAETAAAAAAAAA